MSNKGIELRNEFISDVKSIISSARNSAIKSVDFERVKMYWKLGERIFVEEQDGKDRAEYGSYLIRNLSASITPEFHWISTHENGKPDIKRLITF